MWLRRTDLQSARCSAPSYAAVREQSHSAQWDRSHRLKVRLAKTLSWTAVLISYATKAGLDYPASSNTCHPASTHAQDPGRLHTTAEPGSAAVTWGCVHRTGPFHPATATGLERWTRPRRGPWAHTALLAPEGSSLGQCWMTVFIYTTYKTYLFFINFLFDRWTI